jgi:hypothetical protein
VAVAVAALEPVRVIVVVHGVDSASPANVGSAVGSGAESEVAVAELAFEYGAEEETTVADDAAGASVVAAADEAAEDEPPVEGAEPEAPPE